MKWLFDKCGGLETELSLLAAGALAGKERAKMEAHLADCDACRTKLAELRKLTDELELMGKRLPQVEPTIALRRRWQAAVRQSARPEIASSWAWLSLWLSGRRATWSGLAAIWLLVLLLRVSAPDAPKRAVAATAPISFREVLLVLKVDGHKGKLGAAAVNPQYQKQSHPDALPRGQLSPMRREEVEAA